MDKPRYLVLGPLEARSGDRVCALGGPRQRLVLAVLLANRNHVVSRDALIDAVWAGSPPQAAKTSLHTYLSHLRDELGDGEIGRQDNGYVVNVDRETLDGLEFEHLVEDAGALLPRDPVGAASAFDKARQLWRGSAFGDLGRQPALLAECDRLTDLRLQAEEGRVDAYLELGRHSAVVGDLQSLAEQHPYRERLQAQLMRALYGCGRRADALHVFAKTRRRLAEELGIDPSPELWRLETQIRAHDPTLAYPAGPPTVARGIDLRPVEVRRDTGRGVELEVSPGHGILRHQAVIATPAGPEVNAPHPVRSSAAMGMAVGVLLFIVIAAVVGLGLLENGSGGENALGCISPPTDLTSWWSGDNDTVDLIGGRNATLINNATFGPGLVGGAFVLDGRSYVEVPHDPNLDPGTRDFTIDLWARFSSTLGEQILVEKWVQTDRVDRSGWTLTKRENNSIRFSTEGSPEEYATDTAPLDIPLDTWTHFAARRWGDTHEIFVNGRLVAFNSTPEAEVFDIASTSSLKFGHRGDATDTPESVDRRGMFLRGEIDEVHLLVGRALTDREIRDLVDAGSAGYCHPS